MKEIILLTIIVYLIIINAAGFLLMLIDKKKAKKRRRRIPEAVLLGIAVIGGSIGVVAGMEIFHHKTKHPTFYIGVPLIFVLELIIILAFYFVIIR